MVYYKELHSVECVGVISSGRGDGVGCSRRRRRKKKYNIGRSCFTAGLHSWRTSHKLDKKFPF
jgi:hypothetical protein